MTASAPLAPPAPTAHSPRGARHWRRGAVELAALFTAVAVADGAAQLVVHGPGGPVLLIASALVLLAAAGLHTWWAWWVRRRTQAPPHGASGAHAAYDAYDTHDTYGAGAAAPAPAEGDGTAVLWRMRTTVREEPGSLAALCTALAEHRVDVLSLQTHPLGEVSVDEFLLRAPAALGPGGLSRAAAGAGGRGMWVERADAHDLVDVPTRVLGLAARIARDGAELPVALRQLLGRCTVRSLPARGPDGRPPAAEVPPDGVLEGTVMRLRDPHGGTLAVERPCLPFTPTEFARARALVELDAHPGTAGRQTPGHRESLPLPAGDEVAVRRADTRDLAAARAMHRRCSARTLSQRYHGPVGDADRYLDHLLGPRFGRTLAAETAAGELVALGHLLWDGDETEVAILVEDAWQRRGIGSELLRRLVRMAAEAYCGNIYAVTRPSNSGMVAVMRGLGLPLDYQLEEGTLVVTARLAPVPAAAPAEER